MWACVIGGCDWRSSPEVNAGANGFHFVDVASQVGLVTPLHSGGPQKLFIVEAKGGSAAAFYDHDGDGDLDLYLVNGSQFDPPPDTAPDAAPGTTPRSNVLYRNDLAGGDGSGFTDISPLTGVADSGWGMGVTTADYDNDGDQDIYVTNYGANVFYRREPDGSYVDIAQPAGVADSLWSTGCSFADYDRDGDLDLYVSNYVDFAPVLDWPRPHRTTTWRGRPVFVGPAGLRGLPNVLYQNQGDDHFVDVTTTAGMSDTVHHPSLAAVWGDYDNDGDQDLYVANDSKPNYLFRNNGEGTFNEVSAMAGVATDRHGRSQAGMGCAFEDYDDDGWLDLFVTNFAADSSTLYRNSGTATGGYVSAGQFFTDVSYAVGLGAATWAPLSWGTGFADFDHDGDKDLFVANGHVYPNVDAVGVDTAGVDTAGVATVGGATVDVQGSGSRETYAQLNQLFERRDGRFEEATTAGSGMQVRKVSRGVTLGDYDNDGDIDIFVADLDAVPTLLRNDTPTSGHWLIVKTVGVTSNRDGVGTRITVTTGSSVQIREIRAGDGFLTRSDARAHFGLGSHAHAQVVELRWPSGQVDRIADVAADRVIVVVEGEGVVSSVPVLGLQ